MSCDTSVTYLDTAMVLWCDFGPAIDIDREITMKMRKASGQVMHRMMASRSLTPDKLADTTARAAWDKFCEDFVNATLGEGFKYGDFANIPESFDMLIYDKCDHDDVNEPQMTNMLVLR